MRTDLGTPAKPKSPQGWVQTERKTHEAWARLTLKKPRAAAIAHHLAAQVGHQNAVVISQALLAKSIGCSVRTVQYAIEDLVAERWISVVRLGKGKEAAYVLNDRVAWAQAREQLRLSKFSATIVADYEDQDEASLGHGELRRFPMLYPGEMQLPAGPGEPPPSQPTFDGMEPDLPAIQAEQSPQEPIEHAQLGTLLARIGQEVGGFDLTIERDRTPSPPVSFE